VEPLLHLAASPAAAAAISALFRTEDVRQILEGPPVTRSQGFNLLTLQRAEIVEGERFVIDVGRKRLELYKDGTFLTIGKFADFLGWPRDQESFSSDPKINSLALVEFTYDFFKAYAAILNFVEPLPILIRCQIGITGAHSLGERLWMAPHGLHTLEYDLPSRRYRAPSDEVTRQLEIEAQASDPHIQPGEIAFALLEELYNWFGMPSNVIPYASIESKEIDPSTF
jgi:hypothetical protein